MYDKHEGYEAYSVIVEAYLVIVDKFAARRPFYRRLRYIHGKRQAMETRAKCGVTWKKSLLCVLHANALHLTSCLFSIFWLLPEFDQSHFRAILCLLSPYITLESSSSHGVKVQIQYNFNHNAQLLFA